MLHAISLALALLSAPVSGYRPEVNVSAPTRLDWVFAVANQSPAEPPAEWVKDYDSTAQRYELFVPAGISAQKPAPLILFISPSDAPAGWSQFQALCKQAGAIFASPYNAGNNQPPTKRVHVVLDVLDDVRRQYPVDPDRTYLAGLSGGARVACSIAFAVPEYFGGVMPIAGANSLRDESWLRQRVADRLSVALVTGEQDFNRGELERLRGPQLADVGVRAKVWTATGVGHAIPPSGTLTAALAWLDAGAADRRRAAKLRPAMRIAADSAPTRAQWADALLKEAEDRLKQRATLYSGLMQLQGIAVRWPDVAAASAARKLLEQYESRADRPWEADDLAEQRRFLLAEARGLDRYASGPLPPQYIKQRADMIAGAIGYWTQLRDDDPTSAVGQEAVKRIAALRELAEKKEP